MVDKKVTAYSYTRLIKQAQITVTYKFSPLTSLTSKTIKIKLFHQIKSNIIRDKAIRSIEIIEVSEINTFVLWGEYYAEVQKGNGH